MKKLCFPQSYFDGAAALGRRFKENTGVILYRNTRIVWIMKTSCSSLLKKEKSSFFYQVFFISVFSCKEEGIAHGKAAFGADFGALGTEDALAYPDADSFRLLDEFDGIRGTNLDAEPAPDAPFPLVLDLSTELRRYRNRRDKGCPAGPDLLQVRSD